MKPIRYVFWEDEGAWLGYLEDYPDYMTQGYSHEELIENLKDIYADIRGGLVPHVERAESPIKGRATASRLAARAESPASISVGHRPTFGFNKISSPVRA